MMTNLFSIFDPSTSNNLALNWVALTLFIFIIPSKFFLLKSLPSLPFYNMMNTLFLEYKSILPSKYSGSLLFFTSTFLFIMMMNIMGLFPFIFTPSSHILTTFSLSLTLWLTIILKNILMKTNLMLAHLVPQSTPMLLSSFMVIIESVSLLIRPLTLSIRLTANMIAGHLLLSLISSIADFSPNNFSLSMLTQTMMIILETAVAFIQAFVFSTLILLYSSE
uniref:ATP synthase subunit a n=1 Tax=Liphistius erawan TaxID=1155480 RepID=L7NWN8_LIPER|nr:ATP synthase F0 subunit 6 [Liphistius erawan]AFC77873.1 ATP synthase F0 subunit 6 [Liphistius erawan]